MAPRFLLLGLALACICAGAAAQYTIKFKEIPAPTTVEYVVRTTDQATINGVNYTIQWKPLLESGKTYNGFDGNPWVAGTVLDKYGVALTSAEYNPANARDFDFSSVFQKFNKLWMISQNEDAFGNFYLFELSQNTTNGELAIVKAKTLDINAKYGAIRPCSGSLTPWTTHLAGLEDVVDAKTFPPTSAVAQFTAQAVAQRLPSWSDVSPYWYGFATEVSVTSASGSTSIKKHYSMGRAPYESCVVMPDQQTAICTDDTSSGGIITMFIADKPRDLSSGRLFGLKPTQLNAADGGSFAVEWVPLNNNQSVSDAYVAQYVEVPAYNTSVKFSDLFDSVTPVMINSNTPNLTALPDGYVQVKSVGSRYEWLKLKPGMQALASCLETARMVSYMGGSTEWTKAEGITYDWKSREIYFSLTAIQRSMLDNSGTFDVGGPNLIRLPQNIPGAVMKMKVAPVVGLSRYTPVSVRASINSWGAPAAGSGNNTVPAGSIASPDNVSFMARYRTLIISEDCDTQHANNFGWAYNVDSGAITRIMSTPWDAEVTSGYYFPNVGSHSYLTATVQHPRPEDMPCTMGYWALPRE